MKAIMEQMMNKRRRVYSLETNDTSFAAFSTKYITYLFQALMCIDLSIGKNKETYHRDVKRKLRFEIDMAMVVTIGTHFKWPQTLQNELESNQWLLTQVPLILLPCDLYVPRTLSLSVEVKREKTKDFEVARERDQDQDQDIIQLIALLRELVPGGNEVSSMNELICEVESYVTCLKFQVHVLKSLV